MTVTTSTTSRTSPSFDRAASPRPAERSACPTCRAVAALTDLSPGGIHDLAARMEPVWLDRRRRALDRPGRRTRVGGGRKYSQPFVARLFLTVLHWRWDVTYRALGAMFGVGPQTVERACRDLRPLLDTAALRPVRVPDQRGSRLLVAELERLAVTDGHRLLREIGAGPCDRCRTDDGEG